MDYSDSEEEINYDSDEELQEAFAKGLLKPGLNSVKEVKEKKQFVNSVEQLKNALKNIKGKLDWIETLSLTNGQAALAPEMALKLKETETQREAQLKNRKKGQPVISLEDDPIVNDFKREMMFQRQAQAAILEGIPKLHKLNIRTKRPEDYFAEMAKSDEHMQKVRKNLQHKQVIAERSEKAKNYRAMKKMGKQLQIESKLKKMNEKKEMLKEMKKFRKGHRKDLNFLENNNKKNINNKVKMNKKGKGIISKSSQEKKDFKNKKFGFGGKREDQKPIQKRVPTM